MSCYQPLMGWRSRKTGQLTLSRKESAGRVSALTVPCGNCVGCKIDRARDWSVRVYHEAQMHETSCFITLTYAEMPEGESLDHRHFQNFMKKLRKKGINCRYYMCGEYGDTNRRPHYHCILFGHDFSADRYHWTTRKGTKYYRSPTLESCWKFGFSDLSDFSYGAAAYAARYVSKKINGPDAVKHYVSTKGECIKPEYNRMSLKPGLGYEWFKRYRKDIFPCDQVTVRQDGKIRQYPVPRYYTNLWEEICPTGAEIVKKRRKQEALLRKEDQTPERLVERERLAGKRLSKRNLNDEI